MTEPETASPPPERRLKRLPFTAAAEASILALSNWMRVAAYLGFLGAAVKLVNLFVPRLDLSKLIDAVITLLIAWWVYQAATAFRKVATTDTADQRYLIEGFTLLRRVFLLQSVLIILVLALLVLAIAVIALVAATQAAKGG